MAPAENGAMSKFARAVSVLELFSDQVTLLTAEDIAARLQWSRPTAFRYVAELCKAGFLAKYDSRYALGARITTLDYRIRESDPLLRLARPVMQQLSDELALTCVLCRMYNDEVVAVHQEIAPAMRGDEIYGRGRPLPLFRGAASKIMLAHMPAARLRRLYERHVDQPDLQQIAGDWSGFRGYYQRVRAMGFYVSRQEVSLATARIAAPIELTHVGLAGVLAVVLPVTRLDILNPEGIGRLVLARAADIGRHFEKLHSAA